MLHFSVTEQETRARETSSFSSENPNAAAATGNDNDSNDIGNNEKRMPLMSTPFMHSQQQKEKKSRYVSLEPQYSCFAAQRNAEGRVMYSPVKEYGSTIMMDLGVGAKVWKRVV